MSREITGLGGDICTLLSEFMGLVELFVSGFSYETAMKIICMRCNLCVRPSHHHIEKIVHAYLCRKCMHVQYTCVSYFSPSPTSASSPTGNLSLPRKSAESWEKDPMDHEVGPVGFGNSAMEDMKNIEKP